MQTQTLLPPASFHPISERWGRRETASVPRPGRGERYRSRGAHVCPRACACASLVLICWAARRHAPKSEDALGYTCAPRQQPRPLAFSGGKTKIIEERKINNCLPRSPLAAPLSAPEQRRLPGGTSRNGDRFCWNRTRSAGCSTLSRLISERRRRGERGTPHADQCASTGGALSRRGGSVWPNLPPPPAPG